MPLRKSEISDLCAVCGERALGSCRRCTSPHCETHAHDDDTRCAHCEAYYAPLVKRSIDAIAREEVLPTDGNLADSTRAVLLSGWGGFSTLLLAMGLDTQNAGLLIIGALHLAFSGGFFYRTPFAKRRLVAWTRRRLARKRRAFLREVHREQKLLP